jgi:hypothetical protein
MERVVLDGGVRLVDPDDNPLAPVPSHEDRDGVLANSIRRVVDAAQRPANDTVAAFSNYI